MSEIRIHRHTLRDRISGGNTAVSLVPDSELRERHFKKTDVRRQLLGKTSPPEYSLQIRWKKKPWRERDEGRLGERHQQVVMKARFTGNPGLIDFWSEEDCWSRFHDSFLKTGSPCPELRTELVEKEISFSTQQTAFTSLMFMAAEWVMNNWHQGSCCTQEHIAVWQCAQDVCKSQSDHVPAWKGESGHRTIGNY